MPVVTTKPKVNPVKFVAKTIKSDSEQMKESVTEVKISQLLTN